MKQFYNSSSILRWQTLVFGRAKISWLIFIFMFLSFQAFSQKMIEDFEQQSPWPWTPWTGTYANTTTSAAHTGLKGIVDPHWAYRTDVSLGSSGDKISTWIRFSDSGRAYLGFNASSNGAYSFVLAPNTSQLIFQRNLGYSYSNLDFINFEWQLEKWYKAEIIWLSKDIVEGIVYDSDGKTELARLRLSEPSLSEGGIAIRGIGGTQIDDIFSATIPHYSITTFALPINSICVGKPLPVSFNADGSFNPDNTFTAQLSDASGSFATPVNIGTFNNTSSGIISTTIPGNTLPGTGYRIRVISSSPSVEGNDNGSNLSVNLHPTGTINGTQTICTGQAAELTFHLTGTAPWNITYTDGSTPVTATGILTSPYKVVVTPSTTKTYTLTAVSDALCEATSLTGAAEVTVNTAPVLTVPASITVNTDAGKAGATVSFEATATGVPAPAISYTIDGTAVSSPYFFPVGTTTVTAIATNSCGLDNATFTVTVEDKEAPVAIAKSTTIVLGANGKATISAADIDNGSYDASGIASLVVSKTEFDCSNVGENNVILTATDTYNNVSTANATVTVIDNQKPTVLTKNLTVQLDATGNASITADQIDNGSSDNCSIASITLDKTTFTCENLGENTVTLTVTDVNGNTDSKSAIVTVEDKVAPMAFAKPILVQLNEAGSVTIAAEDINNGSSDNCGIASITLNKTTFNCSNVGENSVTLTVTDNSGNSSTANATVTVEDKTAPVVLTKNFTVPLDATGNATVAAADIDNGSSDNCGIASFILSKSVFDCSNVGENSVTLTVTDNNGNTATANATVTVIDNAAPVVAVSNIAIALDATGNATITAADIDNGSADNCGIAAMELSKTTFGCSNVGANTVTLTVTDVNGNTATANATVTIEDNTAPVVLTQGVTVYLDANGNVTITADEVNNGSSDNCGIASFILSKSAFDCSNVGENTVTLTVKDNSGNTSTATALVTVEDKQDPTITAPAAIVVNVDAGNSTASNVALGNPFATDNCAVASITNNAPATFATGATTVIWTATDASGNTATATQTVTVRPNIVSVVRPAQINLPIRTTFAQVPLPETLEVTYSDDSKELVAVIWSEGSYNGFIAAVYELAGTLVLKPNTTNINNVAAAITVEVEPNKIPTALSFSTTTFKPNATPEQVLGTFSTTDPDDTEHVYTLVSGTGSADNDLFEIIGNALHLKSNKGLSGQTQFSIRVRTTDPYHNTLEKVFTLNKIQYEVPTDKLKIVNAFSPNGDGTNDNWTIPELRFYNDVTIQVFDRSGVRIFTTTNPETGWDGRGPNGQILQGPFLYIVEVKDINWVKRGVVTSLSK